MNDDSIHNNKNDKRFITTKKTQQRTNDDDDNNNNNKSLNECKRTLSKTLHTSRNKNITILDLHPNRQQNLTGISCPKAYSYHFQN